MSEPIVEGNTVKYTSPELGPQEIHVPEGMRTCRYCKLPASWTERGTATKNVKGKNQIVPISRQRSAPFVNVGINEEGETQYGHSICARKSPLPES